MDSEEVQFTSAHAPNDESTNHQQEHPSAPQDISPDQAAETAEATSTESSSTRKRRRRPPRGGARRNHAGETEQQADEPEHEAGAKVAATTQEETATAPWISMQDTNEPSEAHQVAAWSDSFQEAEAPEHTQKTPDFFEAFAEASAPSSSEAIGEAATTPAWSFYNEPFAFTSETAVEPATPAEPAESPAQPSQTAEMASEQEASPTGESPYEPIRAPLSGVEVRPPRRYRFDRPAPAIHDLRRPALQAKPPLPPRPFGRVPTTPGPVEESLASGAPGAIIERELTATPEIEADVVAAEDLSRATQAALEEEIAEEQAAQEEPQGTEEAETAPPSPEAASTPPSRRRRRRRSNASAAAAPAESAPEQPSAQPPAPIAPAAPSSFAPPTTPVLPPYQVSTGLQQLGQPQSPFAGPEPSSARGFGPVPRGVARPAERSVQMPRQDRTVEPGAVSVNQLATIFTQAMQQQTDRLLMELRRSQGTPSMTVNFPPMPSTERVGVFVDVANLLYSARNMRISIDFGRLLDFLRGNRRLVRAHAYCPTSPDPRAEQMFLDAVKGLGYRITTKNYKTFSSGAKKADLDLDLCMDIVRLVDSGAVDCISLVSGDSDFLPLLEYCSDHGVRVEVAAFDEATASILRQSCDLFINLSLVEEIRA